MGIRENADTILRLTGISKIYPGTVALQKVDLDVRQGEVHGIIGKNGAGKSTLVGIIAGMIHPTEGVIYVGDRPYKTLSRMNARKEKVAIVPQEPQVILDCTVAENLFIPDYTGGGKFLNWKELYDQAERIIKRANLSLDVRAKARDLTISERQLLLVVKACYVEEARIIILDEVSASLAQDDEKTLYEIMEERKRKGNTIIFISHRVDELLQVCDRVTVIRDGESITVADCCDLDHEKLSGLIVGEDFKLKRPGGLGRVRPPGKVLLSVENLTRAGVFNRISFQLRKGEVVGLAGLRGSGRTEIFKGIAGIEPVDAGRVGVNDRPMPLTSPSQSLKNGIVYLSEDREHEGLINVLSVRENLVISSLQKITSGLLINKKRENAFIKDLIKTLGIKTADPEQDVSQLSGGNKQKVVVGRVMATQPQVFLLDEPTRGVDIAAKESILGVIKERLTQSAGVMMTSPGLEDLILVCDRILVLYQGEIVAEYTKGQFDEGELYMAVQGVTPSKAAMLPAAAIH